MSTWNRLLENLPDLLGMLFVLTVYAWAVLHLVRGAWARRVLDRSPVTIEANVTRLARRPDPPDLRTPWGRPATSTYAVEYHFTDEAGRTVRGGGRITRSTYETLKTKGTLTIEYWRAHSSFNRPEDAIERRWMPYLMLVLGLISFTLPAYGTYIVIRNTLTNI